jgi:hypothetical protein
MTSNRVLETRLVKPQSVIVPIALYGMRLMHFKSPSHVIARKTWIDITNERISDLENMVTELEKARAERMMLTTTSLGTRWLTAEMAPQHPYLRVYLSRVTPLLLKLSSGVLIFNKS